MLKATSSKSEMSMPLLPFLFNMILNYQPMTLDKRMQLEEWE